ncbi:Retaining alpha-galactosidase precursor [Posidoniimonas polymericola]|uniref:Retaining alpha-galactosidase n=1 Tax=Posidoniimonas polymericola TaxID=2528002 RepID=A0A5C5YLD6_9BACT|nr:glycoside hydrolase family 97 protein [Posidoniimonas polymericola]TWT75694.1 Retaining alpha-galactosidase precursor [Posidoniimonas polymericola]
MLSTVELNRHCGMRLLWGVLAALLIAGSKAPVVYAASSIESPNGRVSLEVGLQQHADDSVVEYSMSFRGETVVGKSSIAFRLNDGTVVGRSLEQASAPKHASHDSSWRPIYGERSTVRDHYNQVTLDLRDSGTGYQMQLVFRCYDAGVAFKTSLRAPGEQAPIELAEEWSEFRISEEATVWCTPRAQSRHEAIALGSIEGEVERPLTIEVGGSLYAAITEARLVDYAAMMLKRPASGGPGLVTALAGGVVADGDLETPWRVVMVGESPGRLLESNDIVLNLSEPCQIKDPAWIRPGKVIREITLTTKGGLACVDFAVKHNLQYIEFDAGWYGHEYSDDSDATTVTVDPNRSTGPLDLHRVIKYGADRNIGVIVYVNRRALETQLDELLPLYKQWGLAGVKYGFVNTGSQEWTRWLHEAVRKAADHELMVDIHDLYRPTGYSRTYPNLMTQEGVRGDEAAPESEQAIMSLFTRNLAGAADHTICYFAPRVKERWTHGHQLAKAVCTYSPWQFMFWYDTPLSPSPPGKHNHSIEETPELEFFAKTPTVWDETRVITAEVGEYAVLARRNGADWFVGALNNGQERVLDVPLDFLNPGEVFSARIYSDDPDAKTSTNVRIDSRNVAAADRLRMRLQPNGGQAVWITPDKLAQRGAREDR